MALPLFPKETKLSNTNMWHLMGVETCFPKDPILIWEIFLKVNYFTADKGKSLICRVFVFYFFLIAIYSMQGWKPLQGMELQEKEAQKD